MFLHYSHSVIGLCTSWLMLFLFITDHGLGQVDGNPSSLQRLVNGTWGQSLKLSLHLPWADPLVVTWDFRNSSAGKRLQVCSKARHNPVDCNNEFGQRIRINLTDYSLEIQTLKKSDQGLYEVNARSEQDVYEEKMELRVYERVSRPKIQLMTNVFSGGICNVTLSCSVESGSDLVYSWWRGGEVVQSGGPHSMTDNGRELSVSSNLHVTSRVYNCRVRNPVSEETESMDLTGPCHLTSIGKDKVNGNLHSVHILVIRALIFMVVVILIIAGVCVWKRRTVKEN
ncbi:LOW QUALITY PROTEIN: SLAM family member 9-like [Scyliorhinus canicula]|uniref:LOW QUALITY PROTEIN: SLAM family member 9-like n=1 Tax=Scyliorhinus canicula TaxID=7830 RepID=UPI0018F6A0A5|nr:LOW QUALITY PROTEIN: SLAM family member 9-like [Scyliorhinus canicula]